MRIPADQKRALTEAAAREGLELSAWLRQLALRAEGVLSPPQKPRGEGMGTEVAAVLGLYDLARCHAAIEAVERRDKPIAKVPIISDVAMLGRVIDAVMRCAAECETGEVRVHVDYRDGVASCAFFRYEWCRAALTFVKGGGFPPPALHWIQGLLFGYGPGPIERFIAQLGSLHENPGRRLPAFGAWRERLVLGEGDPLLAALRTVDA